MIARTLMVGAVMLTLAGCDHGHYEPVPVVVVHGLERVRVASMTEEGDAWLYSHCVYRGAFATLGEENAKVNAIVRGANFVEPMGSSSASSNGVRMMFSTTFASFYCPAFPPGMTEQKS